MPRQKNQKGTVIVEAVRDRLRLRWSYQGKRYFLYLELPDSITNRKVGEARARLIESHMATGTFDPTLERYRLGESKQKSLTVVELFEKFIAYKSKSIYSQSLTKYQGLLGYLRQHFRSKTALQIGEADAEKFRNWLGTKIAPITLRERMTLLKACWSWAIKQKWLTQNPWGEVKVRVPRKPKPQPFTEAEIKLIVVEVRSPSSDFSHYADYIEFLLGTGCRIGEAIALRWKYLNADCSTVHFIESYYRGQFKGLKKEDERFVSMTAHLQRMLLAQRPQPIAQEALVFPAPRGGAIDDHNFRNRVWKPLLEKLDIPYRKPRTTRATLVSHALERGMSPAEVSDLTGHTPETIYRHYTGNVKGRSQLPELLGD